jgi:aminoglycoside 3-N-acetyltransferase
MREITKEMLKETLLAVGVKTGDGLLVHSALQYLGHPASGISIYLDALLEVLGPKGTLAVPTFNFGFARGEPYDPWNTPAQGMGVFSEYVRQLPGARRTPHPMQSLAVIGHHAQDLSERDTLSAFDPGSAFERMLELDFNILLLGADVEAISMLHYNEQRTGVPYRYWKEFCGQVLAQRGWEERTYRMYVRDLELDARLSLKPVQEYLQARQEWRTLPLNYGWVSLCRMVDFNAAVDHFLAQDPWSLVTRRPPNWSLRLR